MLVMDRRQKITQQHQILFHQKDLKQHHSAAETPGLNVNNQRVVATSDSSNSLTVNIGPLEIALSQQPTAWYYNLKLVLPLNSYCDLAP